MLTSHVTPALGINGPAPWARPEFKATGKSPFDYIGDSPDVATKLPKASEAPAAVAGLLTLGLEHKHAATVLGDETFSAQRVATHAAIRDANHGCGEGFRLVGEAAARPVASTPAID